MELFKSEKKELIKGTLAQVESDLEFYEEQGYLGIVTPHYDLDGDHIEFFLEPELFGYRFTDLGLILMRLSAKQTEIATTSKRRSRIFESILSTYDVKLVDGRLEKAVPENELGKGYLEYLIALGKVADLAYTRRDYIRSMFLEEVWHMVRTHSPDGYSAERNWKNVEKDPHGAFLIDFRIANGDTPVYCFAVNSAQRATEALASLFVHRHEFRSKFLSLGIIDENLDIGEQKIRRCINYLDNELVGVDAEVGGQFRDWITRFSRN